MRPPSLVDTDPGALLALHVLLEERHVTRAARRLGITQSSMSHRLQRLRESLGDPLLVRVKGVLEPTPRALAMAAPLASALGDLRRAVEPPAPFDPATSRHTVSIAMPDLLAPLLPGLLAELSAGAPGIDVRVLNLPSPLGEALATGTPSMALTALRDVPDSAVVKKLGEVRFAVAARKRHPILRGRLTVERWLSYPHVLVRLGNQSTNVVGGELAGRGLARRIGVEVPTFLAGLFVVAGSDLLMNAPVPLVEEVADALGLVLRDAPIALPNVPTALVWHERFHTDAAHRWARDRVHGAVSRRLARAR